MRYLLVLTLFIASSMGFAQCFTLFTLTALGTEATAVFDGSGAANPLYVVDWGDGQIDTSMTPVMEHSYASDGFYIATYYYSDQNNPNCSYYSFEAFILTGGSCSLSFQLESIAQAALVDAFAQNTSVPFISIDWGDGSPITQDNSAIHAYGSPGIYEVCVTLTDADPAFPCEVTECQSVEVLGLQGACEVTFEADIQGQAVTLAITGTGGSDTPFWIDWGDGSYSESPTVNHTYSVPDYYTICVYYGLPGDLNCQASICQEIFIDPFASDCVLQMVPVVSGNDVQLQVLAAGAEAPVYFVDWGDGSLGEFGFPQGYTYGVSGTYLICVNYTDSLNPIGCQLNDCQEVTIEVNSNPCTVALTVSNTGLENSYAATAIGEGATVPFYTISWGDNSANTNEASGEHAYAAPGAYEICATYGDSLNASCNATVCETVNVISTVEESQKHISLQVVPVPLTDETQVSFQLPHSGIVQLEVLDMFGRTVANVYQGPAGKDITTIQWDTSTIASGVYALRLTSGSMRKVLPLMK